MKKMLTLASVLMASTSFASMDSDILRFAKFKSEDSEKIVYSLKDCYKKECINGGKLFFSKAQTNDANVAAKFCEANKAESFDDVEMAFLVISTFVAPNKDTVDLVKKLEKSAKKYLYWNAGESVDLLSFSEDGPDLESFSAEQAKQQNIQANVVCKTEK